MSLPNKTNLLPDRPGIPPMAAMPEPETIDIPALARAYADGDIDLICVLGPTASGKTRYAVQLARALGAQGLPSASLRDPIRANAPGSPCAPNAFANCTAYFVLPDAVGPRTQMRSMSPSA